MTTGLPATLTGRIAANLRFRLSKQRPGHCVRVDELSVEDARAVAEEVASQPADLAVHVLSAYDPAHPLEIKADRAIELRNRKRQPLLLLVPSGTSSAASSLDNSFEPLPLMTLLREVSAALEKELSSTPAGPLVREVKKVLGRTRKAETWARFLGAVSADPTATTVGGGLWQVGLVPDLDADGIQARLWRNMKAASAVSRPARPTARVIDRLAAGGVTDGPVRRDLHEFLERREAGELADALTWTHDIGEHHCGTLTFERWPLTESQSGGLTAVKVTPFRKEDGALDPRCKLRLNEDDDQLYCDVSNEQPGTVVVTWLTEPEKPSGVANWRVDVLPPEDLRGDTPPVATMKVKGTTKRATVRVNVDEDDLAGSTLYVVRVQAVGTDGNDLVFPDEKPAAGESDQFEIKLGEHEVERSLRAATAASLPEATLRAAIESGGDLTQGAPSWDANGQVFDVRIGSRRALVRVSRLIARLQRKVLENPEVVAFDAYSPLGEPIDPDAVEPRPLVIPGRLAELRRQLLRAFADRSPRELVEVLAWDDDLLSQARGYVSTFRKTLEGPDEETRIALLAMDTLTIRVGTTTDEVHGLVLLPTHPLRLAWIAAHDQLLRGWAEETARAGKTHPARASRIDFDLVSRLSPANLLTTPVQAGEGLGVLCLVQAHDHDASQPRCDELAESGQVSPERGGRSCPDPARTMSDPCRICGA